jgi:hypothetical protein
MVALEGFTAPAPYKIEVLLESIARGAEGVNNVEGGREAKVIIEE